MTIPVNVDWPALIGNLKRKTDLPVRALCRAAKVESHVGHDLVSEPGHNPLWKHAAPFVNMHLQLLPGEPIPVHREGGGST